MKKQNSILVAAACFSLALMLSGCAGNNATEEDYYFYGGKTCVAKISPKSAKVVYEKMKKGKIINPLGDSEICIKNFYVQTTQIKGYAYLIIEGTEVDSLGQTIPTITAWPIFAKPNEAQPFNAKIIHKCVRHLCEDCGFVRNASDAIIGCKCNDDDPSPFNKCNHCIYYIEDHSGRE